MNFYDYFKEMVKNLADTTRPIVYFSHNDADGVGAVLVPWVYRFLNNNNAHLIDGFNFCAIGNVSETSIGKKLSKFLDTMENPDMAESQPSTIIITDITIPEELLERFDKYCRDYSVTPIMIDHHITNTTPLKYKWACCEVTQYHDILEEMKPAGATAVFYNKMIHELGRKGDEEPNRVKDLMVKYLGEIVMLISDYDVWNWKKVDNYREKITDYLSIFSSYEPDTIPILTKQAGPIEAFKILSSILRSLIWEDSDAKSKIDAASLVYEVEKQREEEAIKHVDSRVHLWKFGEYNIGLYISDDNYFNAISEAADSYEFIDFTMILFPVSKLISFRTKNVDVNVARIAKRIFGGGGHVDASGAKNLDNETFMDFLKMYYEAPSIEKVAEYFGGIHEIDPDALYELNLMDLSTNK